MRYQSEPSCMYNEAHTATVKATYSVHIHSDLSAVNHDSQYHDTRLENQIRSLDIRDREFQGCALWLCLVCCCFCFCLLIARSRLQRTRDNGLIVCVACG
jgi:hypothetical protein